MKNKRIQYRLRPVRPGDAEGLNALRRMPGVFENITAVPTERAERSETMIANLGDNDHLLVATTADDSGGELLIGACGLNVFKRLRSRHSASLGIMVHADYQGMGVGTALLEAILDTADNWLGLVRVELEAFVENEKAIRLYERHGFQREGIKRFSCIRHGKYADEILMARILENRVWA